MAKPCSARVWRSLEGTCVWMGLKWVKRYWASYSGQSRAERGRGSRSSSSVCGGCLSGRISPLKDIGSVASACSHVSDTALQSHIVIMKGLYARNTATLCVSPCSRLSVGSLQSSFCSLQEHVIPLQRMKVRATGRISSLKDIGSVASACTHVSDTALHSTLTIEEAFKFVYETSRTLSRYAAVCLHPAAEHNL